MEMNRKSLFSSAGLVAIAVGLLLSVAVISLLPSFRIDLTEDNLYSLSDGTRNIVSNLQQPIELLFFYSDSATEDVPQIRSYANRIQQLLEEIVIASDGNLILSVIDPEPFSEDEDLATQYGIRAVPVSQGGEPVYLGVAVVRDNSSEDNPFAAPVSEILPVVRPDIEEFLEYEFMKLITKVDNPDRQVIGLLTELDIDGGFDPVRGQATQQWMVMDFIRQLYEVRRIDITGDSVEEDIDILMIVHPEGLSEQMLYGIDQHVMRGGKTLLFLDPNADSLVTRSPQGALIPAGMSSELPGLLQAWGIEFQNDKVLTDNELALRVVLGQNQRPTPHLGMLGVNRNYLTQGDIITNGLESVNLSSSGAIAQLQGAGTDFEPLIVSSTDAMLMDAALMENIIDPSVLFDEFESAGESYVIAARVSGIIDSAFPEGRPQVPAAGDEAADEDAVNEDTVDENTVDADTVNADAIDADAVNADAINADATEEETSTDRAEPVSDNPAREVVSAPDQDAEETVEEEPVPAHIPSSNGVVNIVVFADTDVLSDRLWVQIAQFLGQRIPQPFANNGDLIINTLDNLSGGADLVSIRSRGRYSRPFTRVLDLQREADDRLRTEEAELVDRLAETEAALAELNQTEDGEPIGQITPEIQAEIDRFNAELLDTRRRLRDVQYQLTEDIEQLGAFLKVINSGAIPLLLTILVLFTHYSRGRRRKSAPDLYSSPE